jgi:hypothetical protein
LYRHIPKTMGDHLMNKIMYCGELQSLTSICC